ncbi:MAG: S8 family serine peptidase [candidate division KSB1 bacterium]|nr:S8 family serine peptidase [candidate division KSB1 bacterium]
MFKGSIVVVFALLLWSCGEREQFVLVQPPTASSKAMLQKASSNIIPGKYIIVFKDDVVDVANLVSQLPKAHGAAVEHVYRHALKGFSANLPDAAVQRLQNDPRIKDIVPDAVVTVGPPPGKGPGGGSTGQVTPWGVTRIGGPLDGPGKTVWGIDTGIDLDRPDLNVDVSRSANFVTRGKDSPDNGNGHGTHVAGTIGAIDNDIDVVGVAANATLMAVRVLDNSGSGSYSWVIAGVDYVTQNASPGDVANMSLGGPPNDALDDAIRAAAAKGILFAIAAGNDSDDANNYSPARVEYPNVYTVSAIGEDDCLASFSNWGNPPIEFAAPGVNILSTKDGGGTTTLSGTSMAAPHVAGLLLFGTVNSDGTACNDPDGNPDPIAFK